MFIKVFLTGWIILIVAIIVNYIAIRMGILTWYAFLEDAVKVGNIKAFIGSSFSSKLFLFIIYPVVLGLTAYLFIKNLNN